MSADPDSTIPSTLPSDAEDDVQDDDWLSALDGALATAAAAHGAGRHLGHDGEAVRIVRLDNGMDIFSASAPRQAVVHALRRQQGEVTP